MKKLKLMVVICALMIGWSSAWATVYIETDLTSQFNSLATSQWEGSSGQVDWAAPKVTTNSGLTVAAWENYCGSWNGGCTNTGTIMKTTVTGLTAGTYKIELYGAAAFTYSRGFGSAAFTGDSSVGGKATSDTYTAGQSISTGTGVVLYATTSVNTYSNEIPIWYADNFNGSGLSTVVLEGVVVGDNGQIEIGMSKTSKSTNWHVVQLKGVTATVDAEALFASFKSEAEGLYESPMKASVLSDLQTAANVDLSGADADGYQAAIDELRGKIDEARTSIANYLEAKAILAADNNYDSYGQASYTANATVAAIQSAYDDRSLTAVTADQKTAAKTALDAACKVQQQPVDGCDMTPWITNPSFETNNFSGWTNSGMAIQNNTSFAKTGTYYAEKWQPNGTFGTSQTIASLPIGRYRISAKCLARGVSSAKLYIGTNNTAITIEDASNSYSAEFNTTGNITFGFEGVGTGAETSWLCVDNFELTYVRQLTDEELLAKRTAEYDVAMEAATGFDQGTISTAARAALQEVIDTYSSGLTTPDEYKDATDALIGAVAIANTIVDPYIAYIEKKNNAVTMKDADSYIGADEKTTLEGVISTTSSNVEAATTSAIIETQTSNLVAAARSFVKNVTVKADMCLDITCLLENPHFKRGDKTSATGWTLESGSVGERRAITHNFEAWHCTFNLSQTIPDLPKGTYRVTLQGFARHDGADKDKTNLYCGIVNQRIKDINDEYSTVSLISGKPNMGDGNGESKSGDYYRPNGMSASYYWFQETNELTGKPFYTNEVQTLITEAGSLKIGFKCETSSDWVIWDNFHLYYYGSAISVTIDESTGASFAEDIDDANVTLTRTFSTTNWNTFCVPFAIDNATLTEKFGNEVAVAEYSEESADANNATVTFTKMLTPAVSANVPVLLKTTTAPASITFNGVQVKAGEPKVAGTNFDFVGSYAASTFVTTGNYYLYSNKLYKSSKDDGTFIKGTRAYIQAKTNEARIANFSINDETTGIAVLTTALSEGDGALYNLNGQKVSNAQRSAEGRLFPEGLKKGVFIQNGKKVIKK